MAEKIWMIRVENGKGKRNNSHTPQGGPGVINTGKQNSPGRRISPTDVGDINPPLYKELIEKQKIAGTPKKQVDSPK